MNLSNYGIMTGRLAKDPVKRDNSDGSTKVFISLAVSDNYASSDGNGGMAKQTHFFNLEGFLRKDKDYDKSVYNLLDTGAPVTVQYTVRPNNYEKNGEQVYSQILQIENVQLNESKAEKEARQARKIAKNANADAQAQANAPAETAQG